MCFHVRFSERINTRSMIVCTVSWDQLYSHQEKSLGVFTLR